MGTTHTIPAALQWCFSVVAHPAAGIREFIARDVPGYADLVVDRIFESVGRQRDFAQSGRVLPESQRPDLREVVLGVYRIFYRVTLGP